MNKHPLRLALVGLFFAVMFGYAAAGLSLHLTHELTLQSPSTPFIVWMQFFMSAITTLIFLSSGFILFLLKPFDKKALLLALFFGTIVIAPLPLFHASWWHLVVMVAGATISAFSAPLFLLLTLNFPERAPILRRFPRFEWYGLLPALLFSAPLSGVTVFVSQKALDRLFISPFPLFNKIATALFLLYIVAGLLSFLTGYRDLKKVDRRRVRVVLVATLIAAMPLITIQTLTLVLNGPANPVASGPMNRLGSSMTQLGWLSVIRLATAWLIPPAWAYAIFRHQVIPIRLLIRRSVQYLLAKNALRVIVALPIVGLALTIVSERNRTLSELLFGNSLRFYLLLTITAVVVMVFQQRLTNWIDRKFFREAYNQESILHQLIEDVKRLDSIPEMSRSVTEKLDQALHPDQIYLFYREENSHELSLSYTLSEERQQLRIPSEFQLPTLMEVRNSPQDFPLPRNYRLPRLENEWLASMSTELIVPVIGTGGRLDGLILLGRKKSEVPYTANDRELLKSLANQVAIVYENVRLKERVDLDRRIRNEVLARVEERQINLLKECPLCGACYDSAAQSCGTDNSELTLTLPVERRIEDRYQLEKLIGKGGMGAVYEAEDLRLHRRVAIKILNGRLFGDSAALRRFEREARASARLSHPNIVTVHDYGVLNTEGAFLVMEIVRGETLGARLKRDGLLESMMAAEIFNQVLEGVKTAHAAGIVHRDLKPENVLLADTGGRPQAKVLDFGLAKLARPTEGISDNQTGTEMTAAGAVLGTFGYMSPEQLIGGDVDQRSDLFSLGVMLIEALTRRRPFNGTTHHELLTNILRMPFHLNPNSPGAARLNAVLQRCLAKNREHRFESASEMQSELIPAIRGYSQLMAQPADRFEAATAILSTMKSS